MKISHDFVSRSAEETVAFAKKIAKGLNPGDVIALQGNLGSGKTTFVKGIALGLGIEDAAQVKSPTFVVMHMYKTLVPLYHFDLYRFEETSELEAIGFEDFIHDSRAISCIEWAEKAGREIPSDAYRIRIDHLRENMRRIVVRKGHRKSANRYVKKHG